MQYKKNILCSQEKILSYRSHHAVVIFPCSTAAEEGDEENHGSNDDNYDGGASAGHLFNSGSVGYCCLRQSTYYDERQSTQLDRGTREKHFRTSYYNMRISVSKAHKAHQGWAI